MHNNNEFMFTSSRIFGTSAFRHVHWCGYCVNILVQDWVEKVCIKYEEIKLVTGDCNVVGTGLSVYNVRTSLLGHYFAVQTDNNLFCMLKVINGWLLNYS